MRRAKKHRVKQERPEASSSVTASQEHDLTYYIHDRVELMHQVFSVLKARDLKAMAPNCVQHISLSDLQELCTEELLGISSKRLCAILDGAEPPSDTETSSTSSPEKLETISLDSISSDEEILSEDSSKKKKHKHHRHTSKSKSKHKRRSSSDASEANEDRSKASRAGLTVLELLELQARARAIRAQLQQEQATEVTAMTTGDHVSDDEVEIKEEPAEVVEISSDDEKPKIEDLQKAQTSKNSTEDSNKSAQTVTKRIKDLIITVPVTKPSRKIKLNRNKSQTTNIFNADKTNATESNKEANANEKPDGSRSVTEPVDKTNKNQHTDKEKTIKKSQLAEKEKQKKKPKKKEKNKTKEGSDHDEITLELSDSEKMDLLESLDRKNYDIVSSSSTEDSESSSASSNDEKENNVENKSKDIDSNDSKELPNIEVTSEHPTIDENCDRNEIQVTEENSKQSEDSLKEPNKVCDNVIDEKDDDNKTETTEDKSGESRGDNEIIDKKMDDIPLRNDDHLKDKDENCSIEEKTREQEHDEIASSVAKEVQEKQKVVEDSTKSGKAEKKELSEGEISDRESSEVEASDVKPEIVCISDEEVISKKGHKKKKHKKKEKKAKREKRIEKVQDFRNTADQNFYSEANSKETTDKLEEVNNSSNTQQGTCIDDDVYEILELSDDSSCNEEDGNSVLSKEPTAEEIEALSAKIDEIERVEVITEEEIREHERAQAREKEVYDAENITWKDRYLDSRKVKNVLSTANILNAMRKKNKELKRKLEESKRETVETVPEVEKVTTETNLEEGSIEQYNTLEGSTKYVDPIKEVQDKDHEKRNTEGKVTKEMKKDAKQLLKMYKKLMNYNDMNRQKDSNKKKKKKQKKNKEDKKKTEKDSEVKTNS
ncbi:glutamic acid-rich protein-like [Battus philenor]|uniref:glutamic acid-rich protein-like n=1 Tax=Battus philenor TaxID=42288 RepID=UPI0035D0DE53